MIGLIEQEKIMACYQQKKEIECNEPGGYADRGAWWRHKLGKFGDKTKITKKCEVCKESYVITKNKNLQIKSIVVYGGDVRRDTSRIGYVEYSIYDKALQYIGRCPNCKHEEGLFCEDLNEAVIGDIKEQIYWPLDL